MLVVTPSLIARSSRAFLAVCVFVRARTSPTQTGCPQLRDLDLFNCAVTDVENYRDGIFEMLPSLKYLDGFDA